MAVSLDENRGTNYLWQSEIDGQYIMSTPPLCCLFDNEPITLIVVIIWARDPVHRLPHHINLDFDEVSKIELRYLCSR